MVDQRRVHGAQNAIGQLRRPGDLQEVAADGTRSVLGHRQLLAAREKPQLVAMKDEYDIQSRDAMGFAGARPILPSREMAHG
jgi:hypothetical protein